MPVLLEPISVHSCPLSLHQPNNGIKLSLPSEVLIFLILIIVKPFSIVEENGFVIRPKVINELISAGVSLIRNLTLVDQTCESFWNVVNHLLNKLGFSPLLLNLLRGFVIWILSLISLSDPNSFSFSDMLFLDLEIDFLFLLFERC
jgi:hypothetical protein